MTRHISSFVSGLAAALTTIAVVGRLADLRAQGNAKPVLVNAGLQHGVEVGGGQRQQLFSASGPFVNGRLIFPHCNTDLSNQKACLYH
jgi:hypothetical protein